MSRRSVGPISERSRLAPYAKHPHEIATDELRSLCDHAREVKYWCDVFGIEFRGFEHFVGLLQGADRTGASLQELEEDPDRRPFIWDLKE